MNLKRTTTLLLCLLIGTATLNAQQHAAYNIIPKPVSVKLKSGHLTVPSDGMGIMTNGNDSIGDQASYLSNLLATQYGWYQKDTPPPPPPSTISLTLDSEIQHSEGYKLVVNERGINITAKDVAGIVHGIQTFVQLLPLNPDKNGKVQIENVEIYDYPRFAYRGMHLDVCRHIFPVEFVKKYIDYLAFHKLNTFHWHLTDDQGWRIEILSYPKINQIASWRNATLIGHFKDEPARYDSTRYGGFYTREEIKEVIRYAEIRGIMVIPEIDIPGHSRATIAAYPEFSTKPDTTWNVATTWGMFNRQNNVLAPNPETFKFLETVFGEVADLFPAPYIHIGGDECSKMWWKADPRSQQFIKDHNLKDEAGLQTYFIQQVAKYVAAKGKKVIGWDEILEGDLDTTTVIMSWRGDKGGIDAAKRKHHAIMSAGRPLYFDHYQTKDPNDSLAIHGYNPLDTVYAYNPAPAELVKLGLQQYILGAQANLWTEYIGSTAKVEYMVFPRMTALSEVLWTANDKKDFTDFKRRLKTTAIPRYNAWGAAYCHDYEKWTMANDK